MTDKTSRTFQDWADDNLREYGVHFINKARSAFEAGRAAGVEEAAWICDRYADSPGPINEGVASAGDELARTIRALSGKEG